MTFYYIAIAMVLSTMCGSPVFAQTVGTEVQRDLNQENRIDQGLKSGQLSTGEAAKLERGEANIDRMEKNALKNGTLSPQEAARIQRAQNQESTRINKLDNNAVSGNPNSASSQRMEADVQRNIHQQNRIEHGVQSGALTNKETANLERGQGRINQKEARAGANGHVSAGEQARIQHTENKQSNKIYREKHNNHTR